MVCPCVLGSTELGPSELPNCPSRENKRRLRHRRGENSKLYVQSSNYLSTNFSWMTDFPRGGDIQASRGWTKRASQKSLLVGRLMRFDDAFIKSKFGDAPEEQNKAEMLCGLLNTARESPQQGSYPIL